MRISTSMIFDQGASAMSRNTSDLLNTQAQLSSGKRVTTPSDDPLASAQAVAVSQDKDMNAQYATNRNSATTAFQLEDQTFGSIVNTLQHVMSQVVAAGSASLNDNDRSSIATDLQSSFQQLLSLANTTDANGQYLFSGFMGNSAAYVATPTGASYAGDTGIRYVQVGPNRQIPINDIGSNIFQAIQPATASTVISGSLSNTGTATFTPVSTTDVTNAGANHQFSINFAIDNTTTPPTTNYTIKDLTNTTTPDVTGVYTSGQPITFAGKSVTFTGDPGNGDTFKVDPPGKSSTNVFDNLQALINTLKTPISAQGPSGSANMTNALTTFNQMFSNSYDNVTTVRTTVGSRMNEVSTLNDIGSANDLAYTSQLQDLLDVDIISATSQFAQQQASLQASQQTFIQTQKLSLFSLL
ncbi:flagellar hook-associated protein FlgL [Pandoraea sp. ISTKB]|uniref:flagellar hook-associated protein FlgL n=1 Tax=Pandoraea sp. ISTKB TaxID=1586708 RepID=UPI0008469113|nr:flagellar hook-associated protein FlgL [Pandoraea sp. ISTKB]ODP31163.1 flagellar hook-associated protein 3 [Pandoraea sp. ISTKB]